MKARVPREIRCVLLWRVPPGTGAYAAAAHAARLFRLRVRVLTDADLASTVEALCAGRHAAGRPLSPAVSERPAMIVSGLAQDTGELSRFVDEVRRGGAEIPLRAMVTPTSRGWTLAALLTELNREHDAVCAVPEVSSRPGEV